MASPQREEGHIDIANTIADRLCSYRLSGQEWQIVWVVLRKTWGWLENANNKNGPKKKMDRIALSQFAEMTGINRRKCHALLKKLIEKNIILKTVNHIGDSSYISYGFQKDFDLWRVSPKKGTVPHIGDRVSPILGTKVSPKKAHTKETTKETTKENPPTPPEGKPGHRELRKKLKINLLEKIEPEGFLKDKDQIISFFEYRMSKPKAKQYQTEKGINGLFRSLNGCRKVGLNIFECLEIAMEENWQSPKPEYFKNSDSRAETKEQRRKAAEAYAKEHGL